MQEIACHSQVALAEELGVSRTPLREAPRRLHAWSRPSRTGGCLSVPRLTPENPARLEGYLAEMAHYAAAEDHRRWTVPHRNFHRALTAPAAEWINDLLGQLFGHGRAGAKRQPAGQPSDPDRGRGRVAARARLRARSAAHRAHRRRRRARGAMMPARDRLTRGRSGRNADWP